MKKFKNVTKRGLAMLLALVMLVGTMSLTAFAADEETDPMAVEYGDPYDEIIKEAADVKDTVDTAREKADAAIDSIDKDAADKVSEAQKAVDDNQTVVDAANKTATEAVNTANSAQQAAAGAQEAAANAETQTEIWAAVEIANAAVTTAADAAREAENALEVANKAYEDAQKVVEDAQKALDELTKQHEGDIASAEGEFADAIQAAQERLNAAQEALDNSATARQELADKAAEAKSELDEAVKKQQTAQESLDTAKENAAGLKVDQILGSTEEQKKLAEQTKDVSTKKEALDELGISKEEQQAKADAAQSIVDELDPEVNALKQDLEGKDKAEIELAKSEAEADVEMLTQDVTELQEKYKETDERYDELEGTVFSLQVWGNTSTEIFPGGVRLSNSTIKLALAYYEENDKLPEGYSIYGQGKYSDEELVEFMQEKMDSAGGLATEYENLSEYESTMKQLHSERDTFRFKLDLKKAALEEKENSLKDLNSVLDKFTELENKQGTLDQASEDLEAANGALEELKAAKDAYDKAVVELSKTLKGSSTGYQSKDYEKLMEDAGKLQYAVDKMGELTKAIETSKAAEKAENEAQAALTRAQDGYDAAEAALKEAREATKQAGTKSPEFLAELEANLEKAKAELETAEETVKNASESKTKADEAVTAASKALQDAIDKLPPTNDPDDGVTGGGGDDEVEIEDEAVPLAAGPVTRAEFVDYLWRHEGEPEASAPTFADVPADHEYAPAIGWAQSIGLVSGNEKGEFEPDELVTVAAVRTILTRFAAYASMTMPELTTLTGEDGEAVLNCGEVLAEFFGEELSELAA